MLRKLLDFITFVDLPIRKKFALFSLGVLFWFIAIFLVSIAAHIDINNKTDLIANQITPRERVTHKITRKLKSLDIDAVEIANASDTKAFNNKINTSKARLMDLRAFISTMLLGGHINDINRNTDILIESFAVAPSEECLTTKKYCNMLKPMFDSLEIKLAEIANLRLSVSNRDPQLRKKISEYRQILSDSTAISIEFSVKVTQLYAFYLEKIKADTKLTLFALTGVVFIATTLLIIFTLSISNSIVTLVNSIIDQIRSLGTGKADLTKKIAIKSKDEIGTLSEEFNNLTEDIFEMVTFKKVIEEDESIEDVYSRLGKTFSEKFGLDEYIIYEVSSSKNKMNSVYPIMLNKKEIFCNEEILDNCSLCKVQKTGHVISSMTYPEICKQFKPDLDKEHICIPMIIGGKTGGIVQFLLDKNDISADKKDKRLFRAEQYIKESLSVIEAKRLTNTLRESALKDSLTDLYNRRFLQEYTETLVAGVLRREKVVGLIMCDLDFFKQVNDQYGHGVGDTVLKETAAVIAKSVRSADLVIRFGGEEFLVLLLDIKEGETMKTAEKIRKAIEDTKIKVSDGTIKKTISLGISEFPVDTESFWQAIKYADVALYKAKDTGRNKAVRFDKEMWGEEAF